jgi:predicted HicB family RNase H-like nuclease
MAAKSNTKEKSAAQNSRGLRFELRFIDQAHLDLVERAKQHTGATSMNSWIAQATLAEARRQLAAK